MLVLLIFFSCGEPVSGLCEIERRRYVESRLSPDLNTDEYRAYALKVGNLRLCQQDHARSIWFTSYQTTEIRILLRCKHLDSLGPNAWTVASHPVSSANPGSSASNGGAKDSAHSFLRTSLTRLTLLTCLSGEHAGACKNRSDTRFLNPI